jgi:hypothetical protein
MNMDSECVFSEKGKCVLRVDTATVPDSTCRIYCMGEIDSKIQCPEWGPTIASENYYTAKIRTEK